MELDPAILYDYAVWANERVLRAAGELSAEQWVQPLGHSFGSVHGTLVHILSSEDLWLARWQGSSPRERRVTEANCRTLADVRARRADIERAMRTFLAALGPPDWERRVDYTTTEGKPAGYPLWQMFLQVINHGTHHRAEAATMLTELGHAPEQLDLIAYFRERHP